MCVFTVNRINVHFGIIEPGFNPLNLGLRVKPRFNVEPWFNPLNLGYNSTKSTFILADLNLGLTRTICPSIIGHGFIKGLNLGSRINVLIGRGVPKT